VVREIGDRRRRHSVPRPEKLRQGQEEKAVEKTDGIKSSYQQGKEV